MEAQYRKKSIIWTNVTVVSYAFSFWIQIGAITYLTKKLGVNSLTFGYLQTIFGVVQLLGGPLFGRFGDLFGSRFALAVAFASSSLSYLLVGLSNTVLVLFLSRLPSAFMHGMQGAQMVITDLTGSEQRSDNLGKLSVSYGLGMVMGNIVGGWVTTYRDEHCSALVAAAVSMMTCAFIVAVLPSNTKNSELIPLKIEEPTKEKLTTKTFFDLKLCRSIVFNNPTVLHLMILKGVSGLPIGILHSMFTLIMIDHFHLTPDLNGYVLSYIGVVSMITQGFLIGYLTRRGIPDRTLIKYSVGVLSSSYLALSLFATKSIMIFCIVSLPMVASGALFSTIVQSILTKQVSREHTGSMLGFSMAIHSLIRTISPTIGGLMFHQVGFAFFGWFGFVCNGALFLYLQFQKAHDYP